MSIENTRSAPAPGTSSSRRFPSLGLLLLAVIAAPALLLAQNEPPRTPPTPSAAPVGQTAKAAPQADAMDDLESKEPPDGKWIPLEDGREYFVTRIKKDPEGRTWFRLDEKVIIYKRLYRFELDHEDDEYLYVRYYRRLGVEEAMRQEAEEGRQLRLKVEESYDFEERVSDRLTFASFDQGLPRLGQWRQGLDLADMNRDGFVDIVHGPPRKGVLAPQIFLGDGAGNWRLWTEAKWPNSSLDYGDIAVGDIDGDGLLDLALGIHLRGVKVFKQAAPGEFVEWSKGLPFDVPGAGGDASGFASRAVAFADWNGDGKLDLLAIGEGPRQVRVVDGKSEGIPRSASYGLVVFLNAGSEGWQALSQGEASGAFGDALVVADWNKDGRPDVVTASFVWGNRNVLYLSSGATEKGPDALEIGSLRAGGWLFGVASGDFDGDAGSDLVTSFATQDNEKAARRGLELSRVNDAGEWTTELVVAYDGKDNMWSLDTGDLDGDGKLDLVTTTERGKVLVFLGDGAGHFSREESPEIDPPSLCRGYGLELGDVDGDGRAEIVAGFAGETTALLEFLGTTKCESGGSLRVWRASPRSSS